MNALSRFTLELFRQALHAQGKGANGNDALGVALARVRDEIALAPARSSEVLELLQSLIGEIPAVRHAKDPSARAAAIQSIAEACLTAYYAPGCERGPEAPSATSRSAKLDSQAE